MTTNLVPIENDRADVPAEFQAEYNDDQYINYAQNLHRKIIGKIMTDETALNDPDNRKELAAVVGAMSHVAIQNKRIQVKEKEGANLRDVAVLIAQASMQSDKGNPFRIGGNGAPPRGLDTRLFAEIPISEGELAIGSIQETKEEFLDRMENS